MVNNYYVKGGRRSGARDDDCASGHRLHRLRAVRRGPCRLADAQKVDALRARRAVALMHRLFLRRVVDPDAQGLPAGHDDDVRDRAGRDAHRHRVPALSA